MVIFSKNVHCIKLKLAKFVHIVIMHFLSKNYENITYQLKYMPISISALLNMNKNVLQLNFLNQYFKNYKLGWAEILQAGKYHYSASPHQTVNWL